MKFFWQWRELYKRKEAECIWKEKAFDDLMFISKTNEQRSKKAEAEMRLLRTVNDSLRKRIDGLLDVRIKNEKRIDDLKNLRDSLSDALRLKRQDIYNLVEEIDRMTASQTELEKKVEELKQHVRYYKRDELGRFM